MNTILLKIFSENVRFFRIEKGLSQEELANNSGLHRTYISQIERGLKNVSINNIEKIAIALNVRPYTLLEKNNAGNKNN